MNQARNLVPPNKQKIVWKIKINIEINAYTHKSIKLFLLKRAKIKKIQIAYIFFRNISYSNAKQKITTVHLKLVGEFQRITTKQHTLIYQHLYICSID